MSADRTFFAGRARRVASLAAVTLISALPSIAVAQAAGGASLPLVIGQGAGGASYSVPIQTLLFFTACPFCRRCCC